MASTIAQAQDEVKNVEVQPMAVQAAWITEYLEAVANDARCAHDMALTAAQVFPGLCMRANIAPRAYDE